jgi:hypothetical protein
MMIRRASLTLLLCLLAGHATAQLVPRDVGKDSMDYAFVPLLSYSSDLGFAGGALFSHYDYRGHAQPFNRYIEVAAIASTKGLIKVNGILEQTNSFGSNVRSRVKVDFDRLANDNFFGVGNTTGFDKERWEDDYYFYKSISTGAEYRGQKPIYKAGSSHLDVIGGVGLEYHIPYVLLENSAFNRFTPNGSKGGFLGFFKAGLIWENRDSEFDPGKGNRIALEFFGAPSLTSEYSMAAYRIDLRQYARFFNTITLAIRLEGQHAAGDVPYWRLPTLGDDYTLRGYPLNRFKGASSIASNLELRTWVFRIPSYNIKLGGQLFTDVGRVFTEEDDWGDLFHNYKQTYGFGGAISLFSPDFILRGDIGFSEEVSRIYIGIGYAF